MSGSCTSASMSSTRGALLARAARSVCASSTSRIWRPTVSTGLSAVIGSWKIIAIGWRATPASGRRGGAADPRPPSRMRPEAARSAPFGSSPMMISAGHRFARPALADEAQRLPGADAEGDALQDRQRRARRPSRRRDFRPQKIFAQNRALAHSPRPPLRRRGSSMSRAASPRRLIERMHSDSISPGQKISEGLIWK